MTRTLSRAGLGFIASHEACYLYGYPDPATGGEPITDGIGHTAAAGGRRPVRGARISLATAAVTFSADMARFVAGVERATPGLPEHRLTAATSLHFNTGAWISGSIDDKLRRGDEAGALATWGMYVNAAGKRMAGLVRRRAEEIALWRSGVYSARSILVKDAPGSAGRRVNVLDFPFDVPADPKPELDLKPMPVPAAPAKRPNALIDLFNYVVGLFK